MKQEMNHVQNSWACLGVVFMCALGCLESLGCRVDQLPSSFLEDPKPSKLLYRYAPVLGIGVNFAEDRTFNRCVTIPRTIKPSEGFAWRTYTETRITNHQDLNEQLGVEASVSAKGLWGKGGINARYFKNLKMSEDNFYWLVNAYYELATESIDMYTPTGWGLSEDAKDTLQKEGIQAFYKSCGTHFYMSRTLGAQMALLYEFQSNQDRAIEDLKAQGDYSGFGWDVEGSFKKFMEAARRNQVVRVQSLIVGGDKSMGEYPDDPAKLKEMLKVLRSELEDNQKGSVLEWGIQSYDVFPEVREAKAHANFKEMEDNFRNDALAYYYDQYTQNTTRIATFNSLLSQTEGSEPFLRFSEQSYEDIQSQIDKLKIQNDTIKKRAQACLEGTGDCSTEHLENLIAKIPSPEQDFRGIGDWTILAATQEWGNKIDLVGESLKCPMKRFYTEDKLMEFEGDVYIRIQRQHPKGEEAFIFIGDITPILDPSTGKNRMNICIGNHAEACHLRVIENPEITDHNRCPATKLQLVVFDAMGFVQSKITFFP